MNRIISVINTSEGLGQGLINISIAMSCANQTREGVSISNLNLNSRPTMPFFFDLKQDKSLLDVFSIIERLDGRMLKGFFKEYASNLYFLDIPEEVFDRRNIPLEKIQTFMSILKDAFKFSFVTVERQINEMTTSILDLSDLLVIVVSPQVLSLREAQFIINRLKEFHYPLDFVKAVLNMSNVEGGLSNADVKEYLHIDIIGEIPFDSNVIISAINGGNLPLDKSPHSTFSRSVKTLAKTVINEDAKESTGEKSIFSAAAALKKRSEKSEEKQKAVEKKEEAGEKKSQDEIIIDLKNRIHKRLLDDFDVENLNVTDEKELDKVEIKVKQIIEDILSEEDTAGLSRDARSRIVSEMIDDVLGLGPLEVLLKQDEISEIMVNGPNDIFIEKDGKITLTDSHFTSEDQLRSVIDRILAPLGRRVDESSPLVDARLKDGSRVNIIIPPLSLIGPTITIRKFVTKRLGMTDLVKLGSVTQDIIEFLEVCVKLRKNIIISGGTGSGKTTLLNMVSAFIPTDERIVTIEDSAELRLHQRHVITLESKPPNLEGKGAIPIQRLVINALRMRPDRIIVGECRGGEALDMLQAMNTGHDGSLSTAHANSPRDSLSRMVTMVIMAGTELPEKAILEQIASAVNIIVQTSRMSDGTRKITRVTEVGGIVNGEIKLQDLFYFKQAGLDKARKVVGGFHASGVLPTFFEDIEIHGLKLPREIFDKS